MGWLGWLWAWLFNRSNQPENRAVAELVVRDGDEHVLDIGFGGGASFPHLFEALSDGRVIGVEPSENMRRRAKNQWQQAISEGRLEIRAGTASDLDLPDGSVDVVITLNTVYFWPDLTAGFREVRRVLVPGGMVVISVVDTDFLEGLGFGAVDHRLEPAGWYRDRLEEAGYRDVEIREPDLDKPVSLIVGYAPD